MNQPFLSGDWICTKCNNHNFAKSIECNKCKTPKNNSMLNEDWICKICKEINFGRQSVCINCKTSKDGRYCDWICHKCWYINDKKYAKCNSNGCDQIYSNQGIPGITSLQENNIDNILSIYSKLGDPLDYNSLTSHNKSNATDVFRRKYISKFELLNVSIPRILRNQDPDTGHHSDCCCDRCCLL